VAVPKDTIWAVEPHTTAKHQILRKYLDAWLPILGKYNQRIVYIDGFSGPGEYVGGEPGSPIIALEAASTHRSQLGGELVFWFVEERADRVAHLRSRIAALRLPAHFKIHAEQGTFAEELPSILAALDAEKPGAAPTFALIDPFGFAGIPYALINRLLRKNKSEVLITFMVDSINRWLTHPDDTIRTHIAETFGTEQAVSIAFGSGDRANALKNLYQRQLQQVARFVRYFEMRDRDNRVVYYLFFASNNSLGHVKMKEAMWKVDPMGDFTFSDATNPNQALLFSEHSIAPLVETLVRRFRRKGQVPIEQVETFVNDETGYLRKHMGEALLHLEAEGKLTIAETKTDGRKRRARSFPNEALVTFL
jgi:three-Cys-motif partner protein